MTTTPSRTTNPATPATNPAPAAGTDRFDVAIVGGGIVGLATAWRLSQARPGTRVIVLEKEPRVAAHQTGHNSGVLHSGIYYKPGSLKAQNCRRGVDQMKAFCREHDIAHDVCGKVIVATDESELPAMNTVFERGQANGVDCRLIDADELRELEPHAAGIAAIHVAEAGIVNYTQVCEKLAELVIASGGEVRTGARVTGVQRTDDGVEIHAGNAAIRAKAIVNCGGLHADRVARSAGMNPGARIVPFRGEYYKLTQSSKHLVRNLIYPVPDPRYPFLGVHFTRMIDGAVECGPNAVLALAREGYTWGNINPGDIAGILSTPGFFRFMAQHWKTGISEVRRSLSRAVFVASLQKLIPEITAADIEPAPAGVRAQAMGPGGKLLDDFAIETDGPVVSVLNAPSPAATSSLSIGDTIADRALPLLA